MIHILMYTIPIAYTNTVIIIFIRKYVYFHLPETKMLYIQPL